MKQQETDLKQFVYDINKNLLYSEKYFGKLPKEIGFIQTYTGTKTKRTKFVNDWRSGKLFFVDYGSLLKESSLGQILNAYIKEIGNFKFDKKMFSVINNFIVDADNNIVDKTPMRTYIEKYTGPDYKQLLVNQNVQQSNRNTFVYNFNTNNLEIVMTDTIDDNTYVTGFFEKYDENQAEFEFDWKNNAIKWVEENTLTKPEINNIIWDILGMFCKTLGVANTTPESKDQDLYNKIRGWVNKHKPIKHHEVLRYLKNFIPEGYAQKTKNDKYYKNEFISIVELIKKNFKTNYAVEVISPTKIDLIPVNIFEDKMMSSREVKSILKHMGLIFVETKEYGLIDIYRFSLSERENDVNRSVYKYKEYMEWADKNGMARKTNVINIIDITGTTKTAEVTKIPLEVPKDFDKICAMFIGSDAERIQWVDDDLFFYEWIAKTNKVTRK